MFSPTDGIPPFSQVSPYTNWYPATSSSSPFSSIYENPSSTISQHEDLLAYYLSTQAPPIIDSTKNSPKTSTPRCRPRRQKSTRKERHSKIFTAQGPRDRRVRLSIDISKRFFGLQDLLGFDKASLTLDWLLTSSKTDIEELLRSKKVDSYDKAMCQLYSSSEAEDDEPRQKNANNSARKRKRKRKSSTAQKHHNTDAFLIEKIGKETRRAQARARARERTRVKNYLRSLLICSQQHKLPDLFNSPRNPTSGESSSPPPPLPVEAGFIFVNPQTSEVNTREKVKTRPFFYHHMLSRFYHHETSKIASDSRKT